jgi:hypothetical protein
VNPVLSLLNLVVGSLLHLVLGGAATLLQLVVFRPLALLPAASAFVGASRSVALAGTGAAVILAGVRALWPGLVGYGRPEFTSGILVRAVAAAGLMAMEPAALRLLFFLNNRIVSAFVNPMRVPSGTFSPGMLASAPLWLLALLVILLIIVTYLSLLYVTRLIHIVWLAGLIPWFLLWWLVSGDDGRLGVQVRELVALTLTQALQATAWWLAVQYMGTAGSLSELLFAAGSLWFMVMVPGEFRRLMGLGSQVRPRLVLW